MGSILNAECVCGYRREGLFMGAGMLDFEKVCSAPAFCENCHEVVLADYLAKAPKCPKCKGKPIFYDDVCLRFGKPGPGGKPLVRMAYGSDRKDIQTPRCSLFAALVASKRRCVL